MKHLNKSTDDAMKQCLSVEEELSLLATRWERTRNLRGHSEDRLDFWTSVAQVYKSSRVPMKIIAERFGCSQGTICDWFRRTGFAARRCYERVSETKAMRYCLGNARAFETIDSASAAYWLGFLWADGFIRFEPTMGKYTLRVVLGTKDRGHLQQLKEFLQTGAPVKDGVAGKNQEYKNVQLEIHNKQLVECLAGLGIVPHRTETRLAFERIPEEFKMDFVRGLMDGDGHIKRDARVKFFLSGWDIGLAGSPETVSIFEEALSETNVQFDIRANGATNHDRNQRATASGPSVFKVLEVMYERPGPALLRKQLLALSLIKAHRQAIQLGLSVQQRGDGLRFVHPERVMHLKQCFLSAFQSRVDPAELVRLGLSDAASNIAPRDAVRECEHA